MNRHFCLALAFSLTPLLLAEPPPRPVTAIVKTKSAQMKYDLERINSAPGAQVTITLQNDDDLPHNLVVCKPKDGAASDKGLDVAMAAWNLGEAGMKQEWIPENSRILAHTKMVNPHQSETITFTAPTIAADYPYVCTFPGHAMVMNGALHVGICLPPVKNLHYRYYTGDKLMKLPDFSKLKGVEEGQLPSGRMEITTHQNDRSDDFAYEFEGTLECPKDGDYTFSMSADAGSQLWIDGKDIMKTDLPRPAKYHTKKVKLSKGDHNIKVHYYQGDAYAAFHLAWETPGYPQEWLTPAETEHEKLLDEKNKTEGIPLVVTNETRIYRNFIAGSSPRGIAVGYPGGVNLCWDADQMNLALIWEGAFMDAKRHWDGRGKGDQPPLGYGVAKLGKEHALAVLVSQTAPWVPALKSDQPHNPAYTFLGYELDAQRNPTFKYQFNDVTVIETFEPAGDSKKETAALKRVVKLSVNKPVDNLYLLALAGPVVAKDNSFIFDKTVNVTINGSAPLVRQSAGRDEVLLPVIFTNEKAEFTINYSWSLK